MHIDPARLTSTDRYKLMIGAIVPRPIALVSTRGLAGELNLAPFSFFSGIGSDPMMLLFCPANRADGQEKDSLRNAKPVAEGGTGEFVVNVVSHALAQRMAACAAELPYGQSEFDFSTLSPVPSAVVAPQRVGEALCAFECRTRQVIRTNPGAPGGGNVVLGEVVSVYAAEGLVNERLHMDASRLDAIGRMGGLAYCTTRDRFEMRPGERPGDPGRG
jgi:flavin reductase (DIM6/NTAB) family NADH-FMN oxidoreductase RutF